MGSILLVDDDVKILQLLEQVYSLAGYQTFSSVDGQTALEILTQNQIDLLILDVSMDVMDGFEVCSRIKANPHTQNIPIIFLTARNRQTDLIKGEQVGGDYYIMKPFSVDELLTITNIALHEVK